VFEEGKGELMKNKIIAPKVFANKESMSTPRHDDMLLILTNNKEKFVDEILEHFELKGVTEETVLIEKVDDEFRLYRKGNLINEYKNVDGKFYINDGHWEGRREINSGLEKKCRWMAKSWIELWKPEFTIKNNDYYIGSLDLFIRVKRNFVPHVEFKKDKHEPLNLQFQYPSCDIIVEFKPTIRSFSETIRQINVYRSYLSEKAKMNRRILLSVVYTFTDISKFKKIFEDEGIFLKQLSEHGSQMSLMEAKNE
jgi:hypothetical protein